MPGRKLKGNKSQKTYSGRNLKMLRIVFSKIQKLKNYPKNTPKPKSKKIKKSHNEAPNKNKFRK